MYIKEMKKIEKDMREEKGEVKMRMIELFMEMEMEKILWGKM